MSEQLGTSSELVELAKLNGSFKRNYGTLIGAYLYLRSISVARCPRFLLSGMISLACSGALVWLAKRCLAWLGVD